MNGFPQSHTALLDQIQQKDIPAGKFLCHLHHPTQTGIGQGFGSLFVAGQQFLRQKFFFPIGRNPGDFLQVQTQRVIFFHVGRVQPLLYIFLFLLQPLGRLARGDGSRQGGNIQIQPLFLDGPECILHRFIVFIFQHGNQIPSGDGRTVFTGIQISLPGALFELNIDHSRKSSNPILVPIAWSLSMAWRSICLVRSLEMPSSLPISSRECSTPSSRPKWRQRICL